MPQRHHTSSLRRRPTATIVRPLTVAAIGASVLLGLATPAAAAPGEPAPTDEASPPAEPAPEPPAPEAPSEAGETWRLSDEPTELTGTQRSTTLDVSIPAGWTPTGPARLTLAYSVGALTSGTISVAVDGDAVGVVEVNAPGESVVVDIPADEFGVGRNSIRLTSDLVLTVDDDCRDPLHPERRVTFGPESRLNLPLAPAGELDIADFPAALEPLGGDDRSIDVHLVGPLTTGLTAAATDVIGAMRSEIDDVAIRVATTSAGTFDLDALSPDRPAVVIGTTGDLGDAAPEGDAMLTRTPGGHGVLTVTGGSAPTLERHARELADAVIDRTPLTDLDEVFSLADLGYDDRTLDGPGTDSTLYGFDLPINEIPERLTFNLDARRSSSAATLDGVGVIVNGQRIGVAPFDDAGRTVDIELDADRSTLRPGRNLVRVEADFAEQTSGCAGAPEPQSVDVIASSTVFEQGEPTDDIDLDLEDLPFVFRTPGDSDDLNIVLPERPTDTEVGRALELALLLGADGRAATVVRAADLDERSLASEHLVIIGELSRQPTFERLASTRNGGVMSGDLTGLPISSNGSEATGTATEIPDAIIRFVPTSVASERLIMVVTGSNPTGVATALGAILDIEQRADFEGASVELVTTGEGEEAELTVSTQTAAFVQTLRDTPATDTFEAATSTAASPSSSSSSIAPDTAVLVAGEQSGGLSTPGTRTWMFGGLALALAAGIAAVRYRQMRSTDETSAATAH